MKKLFTFLIMFVHFTLCTNVFSQTSVFDLKEEFGSDASNWGFTLNNGSTQTFTYNSGNKLLQCRWSSSASSEYIKTLSNTVTPGTDNKVTVEFIIQAYTCGSSSNFGAIYLLDESGNAVTGFHVRRGSVGGSNKWFVGRCTSYPGTTTYSYPTSADPLNADQPIAKITFVLDFNLKTLSFSAAQGTFDFGTRVFTASGSTVSSTAQPFINTSASNIKSLRSWYYRASSTTGTNGFDLMYAGISALRSVASANVTIRYQDQDNNYFKSDEIITGEVVNTTYNATLIQKASVKIGEYYYVLNPASPTSVVVNSDGSTLTLKFTKSTVDVGPYTWTGAVNSNWNDFELNFKTPRNNNIAYQNGNSVIFDGTAINKTVTLIKDFDLGSNNISVTGDSYNFDGSGGLSGTGSFIFDLANAGSASINQKNSQTGGIVINSGDITVLNQFAGTKYTIGNNGKIILQTGAAFSKEINALGSIISIQNNSNVFYSNAITGTPTTVNLNLGVSGSLASVDWSSKVTTVMPANAQVNVTTNQPTAGYGVAANSVQNSKLNLGDNVRMLFNYNPTEGGTTIISIGELCGTSLSSVEGGWVNSATRGLNYQIGSLNTDATFNGVFKNYSTALSAPLNISKKGTGTWTLTGTSTDYVLGAFNVDAGKVIVNGTVGTTGVTTTVAVGATLSGTGIIGGATTVNGTLEGKLNFGSTLLLTGTTNLTVNGFNAGEFDQVNVTGALTNGGILNVTANCTAPVNNTTVQLLKAGSYIGVFSQKNLPANYSFDDATGTLTYNSTATGLEATNVQAGVYPVMTRGNIFVTGASVERVQVCNLAGHVLKSVDIQAENKTINISDLSSGAYLVKVFLTNGSSKVQKILLNK